MTFGQFWSLILKQWKLILICFLIVGLGTYIGSKLITPLYQSTALVQVAIRSGNNQADYNSLLAGPNSDATTSERSAVQATGGNQARVAVLQVQLNGLQQHYREWQTLLDQLELTQAQDGDFLRIAQSAEPGISPVRPNVLLNT